MPDRFCLALLALTMAAALGLSPAVAKEPTELVLTGPPWAPYLYEDHEKQGFAVEVVSSIFDLVELEAETKIVPWRRVIWVAQNEQADGLIGVWHHEDREEFLIFSDPYYSSPIVAVYHKDNPLPGCSVDDLAGKRAGLREGAWYGAAIMEDEAMHQVSVSHDLSMLRMLKEGRLDSAIGDGLILNSIIEEHEDLREALRICGTALADIPLHFAAVKSRPDAEQIVEQFNQGLKQLRESSEYERIYERYELPRYE